MGSSRHGYRGDHASPSSFLGITVSPKISEKYDAIGYHLLGCPQCSPWLWGVTATQPLLDSGWGRGRRGARQRREAFGQRHLPAPGQVRD